MSAEEESGVKLSVGRYPSIDVWRTQSSSGFADTLPVRPELTERSFFVAPRVFLLLRIPAVLPVKVGRQVAFLKD